jgi:hypothetical protein
MSTVVEPTTVASPFARVCWSALQYELPVDDASTRAFLWRQLRTRGGLSLRRGLWAVPHGGDGGPDLHGVVTRLRSAGGAVDVRAVGAAPEDAGLHELLTAACTRLWSGFSTAADRLAVPGNSGRGAGGHRLEGLHELFARTLAADLVQSPAIDGAARRLDDLEWIHANVRGPEATPRVRGDRPTIEVMATVVLDDGTMRAVARLGPTPTPAWERGLAEFEAATYRPDPRRVAVRHGTVVVTGASDEIVTTLRHVADRIARFNVTFS